MKKQQLRTLIKESITDWLTERVEEEKIEEQAILEDQISEFYFVTKPSKNSTMEELVGQADVFEFATKGLTREEVYGIYKSEGKAKTVASKLIKERDIQLKETYKKGQEKLKQMESSIDEIKSEIEGKMSEATSNPDMRESLTAESNGLMKKLSMLEAQIEKLRDALEAEGMKFEKKSSKKDKKEEEETEK
jgi:hypothetical protein